ncbi:MAG TPA: outer membrane beta-barrel protein [Thermoanaerobaculia bacterium]
MKKSLLVLLVSALAIPPAQAQDWSLGVATGPFVFGDFIRRTLQTGNEGTSGPQTTHLSAKTRPGFGVDIERNLNNYFAVRLEGTFTRAPLAIKGNRGGGVALESGKINVGTFTVPLVVRFNPHGTFRIHVMGGPAYAIYDITKDTNAQQTISTFAGSRGRWGAALGGGVAWQWTRSFAVEGQFSDVNTESPFRRSDLPSGLGRFTTPRPHNVHTTVGLRYRF